VQKFIYLLWAPRGARRDAYADGLLEAAERTLLRHGPLGLALHVSDHESRVPSPSPGMTCRPPFSAMLSLWLDDAAPRAPYDTFSQAHAEHSVGYCVSESVYTDWGENRHAAKRAWPDGERSPGVFAVTLLERPRAHEPEAWHAHWFGTQSPVSEAMQPRARYVRNVVNERLSERAPRYAGIVEEAWPSARHVTDPYLFYGANDLDELVRNMGAMLKSVTGFLALPRIQTVMLSEYVLRTPPSYGR
jgi:hypothetical protein